MKRVNLALQGGGSHGAFTWGVLDRLLQEPRLAIEAISGTSAGAINAVVMAEGLRTGGPEAARQRLGEFWRTISLGGHVTPVQQTALNVLLSNWAFDANPLLAMFELMSRVVSPYQFNPLNLNPLKELLNQQVNFSTVQACDAMQLYIPATNVHTGRAKVFTCDEITADSVMASACLPFLFQAVEIDGIPYWDGGYMGNPVLFPFVECSVSRDVVIVQVNPIERNSTPVTSREIIDRVNEISFNAPLIKELRHINFINAAVRRGDLADTGFTETYLHRIGGGSEIAHYSAVTKINAEWGFLQTLHDIGVVAADRWLNEHFDDVGARSTMAIAPLIEFAQPASPRPQPEEARPR